MGILLATAVVLSIVEGLFPIPAPVPGIRLGLSNIVVMFALLNMKKRYALIIALLKALFVLLTRGVIAGILSASGGLASVGVMALLLFLFSGRISYLLISVSGAAFHNIGQIAAASVILSTPLWIYLPILLVSAILPGFATAVILKTMAPVRLRLRLNRND